MPSGFSSTVTRFFRAFHRHDHGDPTDSDTTSSSMKSCSSSSSLAVSSLLTAGAGRSSPKQTRLPSNFTRHVRQLVDYVSQVAKLRAATPPASVSSTARRHVAAAKVLDRIAQTLQARDSNDQSGTRAVPLNVALEQLLTVWECVLQCLDLSRAEAGSDDAVPAPSPTERLSMTSSTSSSSGDGATRLESAARRLLALLIQQREFDIALMALGRGECNVHQNDGTRKRSIVIQDGCVRLDDLRVSMHEPCRNSTNVKRAPAPRPLPSKRDVSKTSDAPLCVLSKKYLDLHQTTLRLLQDVYSASGDRLESRHECQGTSDRALLLQLLAASYTRVPALRDAMLAGFQLFVGESMGRRRKLLAREQRRQRSTSKAHDMARDRSMALQDEVNVALFFWTQSLSSKCHVSVAPYNREEYWTNETGHLTSAMNGDVKFQRVLLAQLMDHFLMVGGTAGIDWKCLPGATTLKEALLTMTELVYTNQIEAAEQALREKQDASAGSDHGEGSALKSDTEQSFSLSTTDDWTIELFLPQTMRVLACNSFMIHDWMMTILHNTNAVVATHVTLCLRYLSQLLTECPAYFCDDATNASSTVLLQIFTQLLASDHYEILRNTELFLLKHFGGFSVTLRESLVAVFAVEFKRLFLHWNRDVRFCFYHMLLYLTYPGNRLVLGATSDELLMDAEASYLFDIPGLNRHSASAAVIQWEALDKPLCELIRFVNRTLKQAATKKSLAASSASTQIARNRPDRSSSSVTMRLSRNVTHRSKPTARAGLGTQPSQYGRAMRSQSLGPLSQPAAASKSAPSATQLPPPPAWIQALPLLTVQRSVQEYRRHVKTYYAVARQISIHDPVPMPLLSQS